MRTYLRGPLTDHLLDSRQRLRTYQPVADKVAQQYRQRTRFVPPKGASARLERGLKRGSRLALALHDLTSKTA